MEIRARWSSGSNCVPESQMQRKLRTAIVRHVRLQRSSVEMHAAAVESSVVPHYACPCNMP